MLDTDFAKLLEAEPIPEHLKLRLEREDYDVDYLSHQARRYRYAKDQEERDDLLCRIASRAGLFSAADMEAIDDRTRQTGRFSLQATERQQVLNWLEDELAIYLESQN